MPVAEGLTLRRRGRLDEAGLCHQLALDLCDQYGIPTGLAAAHAALGYLAELRQDADAAVRHHQASLDAACEAADHRAQALALEGLAGVASLRSDPRASGLLLGASRLPNGPTSTVRSPASTTTPPWTPHSKRVTATRSLSSGSQPSTRLPGGWLPLAG